MNLTKFYVFIAVVFGLLSVGIWFFMLKSVPTFVGKATIKSKIHKPAGEYWQQPVGINRGFRTANKIPMAEAYVIELFCEDLQTEVFYSESVSEAQQLQEGSQVVIDYQMRKIPFYGTKVMVLKLRRPEESRPE